ncbi:PhnE/PtxC family ABC transporter permease [Clostridium cylindrosporum]|uniref:Phosphite transport system permease protein PtxC n=1 Tax=Clostridium cylindrosporum DSM 605 TaxID=1121307 RepID=A0A0J8DAG4_CLOCY|nr:ABC transporter permease subunit [Clostridium cylindrosporum]KMT22842.1 phosphite transport system permease protein PtxC [Clostridium cylindrosporum DSM 605]
MNKTGFFKFHKRNILTLILILTFVWSLFSVKWNRELIHTGGMTIIKEILNGIIHPNLSSDIILLAIKSSWITLAYAVAGISIAIIIGFVFGVLASGVLCFNNSNKAFCKSIFRSLLGFMRCVHELVWALLFVTAIGLSPYAAIFALAIPYGGILGRIYADMLNDVNREPIEALRSSGASRLQLLLYGYLPMVKADMFSYTMYRFECATRSSTVMSFIGLGGLGYQIQLALDDLKYGDVWTYMYFLVTLVVITDLWSNMIRKRFVEDNNHKKGNFNFIKVSLLISIVLIIASWIHIVVVDKASLNSIFTEKNLYHINKFFSGLIGAGEENPAFYDLEQWRNVLKLTLETLQMSIMAIGFATIGMVITVISAARTTMEGKLTLSKGWFSTLLFGIIRALYIFSRSVPELVWAMIIIFIFKPGILPGAVALALHNFGILGKLCAEVVEDINLSPIRNLSSSGGNSFQILLYGVIPSVMQKFITYILYRWEVIIRTTIVVGFVGAGGLGQQFKLSMSYFKLSEVTLILIAYLILVAIVDILSEGARKLAE